MIEKKEILFIINLYEYSNFTPFKENYSSKQAGAVSLFINDINKKKFI